MTNEPIIYDENTNGKVTKIIQSEEGVRIEQYQPEHGMSVINLDQTETTRLLRDIR